MNGGEISPSMTRVFLLGWADAVMPMMRAGTDASGPRLQQIHVCDRRACASRLPPAQWINLLAHAVSDFMVMVSDIGE